MTEIDLEAGCLACGVAVSATLGFAPDEATIATVLTAKHFGPDDVLSRIRRCSIHQEMLEGMETRMSVVDS